jgi:type VI protein secretion system component VasF
MRYGLELFPMCMALAVSGRYRVFHYAYVAMSFYLALRFMTEFAQSVWVA